MQYESDKIKCTEYLVYSKTSAETVKKNVKKQKQKNYYDMRHHGNRRNGGVENWMKT